ncbi:MscS mechanosensitive ion channel [Brucella melitensis]|nr:MscS mechanosensitive ion channel [Brucella melitensis]
MKVFLARYSVASRIKRNLVSGWLLVSILTRFMLKRCSYFNGRIEIDPFIDIPRPCCFSAGWRLSLGALAPAVAQNDKQQNPPASQSAPAEKPNGQAASAADQRPPEPVSSPVSSIVQQQRPTFDELKQLTKKINEQLSKSASSDEALANLKLQLDALSKKLLETGVAFRRALPRSTRGWSSLAPRLRAISRRSRPSLGKSVHG